MGTTRRSALTASSAAVLAVAGCSAEDSDPGGSGPSTLPSTATTTISGAAADPDRAALDRAFEITSSLVADLAASDAVISGGGDLAQIHAAHLMALQVAAGAVAPTASPSAGRHLGAARLRRRELKAQRELAALAGEAESGALARLFASMSAGIAAGLSHRGEVPR